MPYIYFLFSVRQCLKEISFGITFDNDLSFKDHISQKINKAYSILGIIKRNFIYMDESGFILLYKSMVRPHL